MHNNKKQINKDSDGKPKTEKHLSRSRLNFIWDSKRKYSKSIRRIIEKYIFHVSLVWRYEAPRHMTELVLSQHSATKALDFFDFSSWNFHYFSPWKVKEKFKSIKQTNETNNIRFNYFTTNNFSRQFTSINWAELRKFSLIKTQEKHESVKIIIHI